MFLKSVLRNFIPTSVLKVRSRRILTAYAQEINGLSLRDRFSQIYAREEWGTSHGRQFFSGPGSLPSASAGDEAIAGSLFEENPSLTQLVDLGCGDFQVARRLLARVSRQLQYIGCDIVPELIALNQAEFGSAAVRFETCDITTDTLPQGDVILCREVLQHLSNQDILRALERISVAGKYALFTNTIPNAQFKPNLDLPTGAHTRSALGSGLLLDQPPFALSAIGVHQNKISAQESLHTLLVQF